MTAMAVAVAVAEGMAAAIEGFGNVVTGEDAATGAIAVDAKIGEAGAVTVSDDLWNYVLTPKVPHP